MKVKNRDYRKEYERRNELNKNYHIALKREIAEDFEDKLKTEKKTISSWFKENVTKYLEK